MKVHTFEIYSGQVKRHSVCVETVQGIGNAYELMTKIAARSPGPYFILCKKTNTVCGSINTSTRYAYAQRPVLEARE